VISLDGDLSDAGWQGVEPVTTWFEARVPADRWRDAAAALRSAMLAPTQSRSQVERIRELLLRQSATAVQRDPIEGDIGADSSGRIGVKTEWDY
jgi:hypothetical protein